MTSSLEFNARAALCRQLARREPNSKILWLAEAERWSRLPLGPRAEVRAPEFRNAGGSNAFVLLGDISPEAAAVLNFPRQEEAPRASVGRTVE
jgi:hypothetical protein